MSLSSSAANVVLAAIVLLFGAAIHRVQSDDCSTLKPMDNFNISQIIGEWRHVLIQKSTIPANEKYICTKDYFARFGDGAVISKRVIIVDINEPATTSYMIVTQESDTPSKLTFTEVEGRPSNDPPKVVLKYVLGTDNYRYAILVYCKGDPSQFVVEVITRSKFLFDDVEGEGKVHTILKDAGLPDDFRGSDIICGF